MTSLAHQLHQAHKARLFRIEQAAARLHSGKIEITRRSLPRPAAPQPCRREYETTARIDRNAPLVSRVLVAVACEFNLLVSDLTGPKRTKNVCIARFVTVGMLVEMTRLSLPAIGRRLGNRDHTTIIHARDKAAQLFASEAFRNRVDQIKSELAQ